MDYDKLTDEQIVTLHQKKQINAIDILFERFEGYSTAIIKKTLGNTKYYNAVFEMRDILMMDTLIKTLEKFRLGKGKFKNFYGNIFQKETIKMYLNFKKNPLVNAFSIDRPIPNTEDLTFADSLPYEDSSIDEEEKRINELNEKILKSYKGRYRIRNKEILKLRQNGVSYKEIAKLYNCSIHTLYSLVYRFNKNSNNVSKYNKNVTKK